MDQIMKSTLASVGSKIIDVRDQEGNTLLILACRHACEVTLEPHPTVVAFGYFQCCKMPISMTAAKFVEFILRFNIGSAVHSTQG